MMQFTELLAQGAVKGTLILAAGFAVAWLPSRVSAAFRHYAWTLMFAALLILPAVIALAPRWSLPLPVAAPAVESTTVLRVSGTNARPVPPPTAPPRNPLPWVYLAGVAAVAIRFTAGAIRTNRLLRGARPVTRHGVPVPVLASANVPVPLVWGIARPVIVLPSAFRNWPADRLRAVLLHEFLHVRRGDLLAQMVTQAACCLYWFHPLAWIAAREQRKQRERACDDAVLRQGFAPADYAGHLVELVRGLTIEAPAMAEASDFEGRVRDLLDRSRNRAPMGRGLALAGSVLALALILPLATLTSHAQAGSGALAGIVMDPSGARVPGVGITARNLESSNMETATADAAGEFGFRSIPAGRYEIEARSRGFKITKQEVTVTAGNAILATVRLELGEISEAVTVKGNRTSPAPVTPRAAAPQRIPVGGYVQPSKLLRQPRPEYPEDLQRQGITGTVVIRAVVGTDGRLLNPKVVNTEIHPRLAQAALDAVAQWLYEPTRLNGQPVETLTKIEVAFSLDQ